MSSYPLTITTHSYEETFEWAKEFGQKLLPNDVVCFFGGLGAGKTSFIKGLAKGASNVNEEEVQSPTFALLNIYLEKPPIYHFDLYRLNSGDEFFSLGFDEYFSSNGICCIEWAERIKEHIPEGSFLIYLEANSENERKIIVQRK